MVATPYRAAKEEGGIAHTYTGQKKPVIFDVIKRNEIWRSEWFASFTGNSQITVNIHNTGRRIMVSVTLALGAGMGLENFVSRCAFQRANCKRSLTTVVVCWSFRMLLGHRKVHCQGLSKDPSWIDRQGVSGIHESWSQGHGKSIVSASLHRRNRSCRGLVCGIGFRGSWNLWSTVEIFFSVPWSHDLESPGKCGLKMSYVYAIGIFFSPKATSTNTNLWYLFTNLRLLYDPFHSGQRRRSPIRVCHFLFRWRAKENCPKRQSRSTSLAGCRKGESLRQWQGRNSHHRYESLLPCSRSPSRLLEQKSTWILQSLL